LFQIIGIVLLFALVFGSFIISAATWGDPRSPAHEMMAIGGAGTAAFLISNSMTVIKATGGGMAKVFAGQNGRPPTTATCFRCCFCSPRQ